MSSQSISSEFQQNLNTFSPLPFTRSGENSIRLLLLSDEPGEVEVPSLQNTIVSLHVGASVQMSCRRGGANYRGTAVHGDIDIIPAHTPGLWEIKQKDTAFVLSLSPQLIKLAAEEFDFDPSRVEIRNRFLVRDTQLENIGWALKSEMECGYPSGRLYVESLAVSVAARLVACHSTVSVEPINHKPSLSGRKLKEVLAFIEDNLSRDVSLANLAAAAGLSVSHFKTVFRESVGMPAHQYVIRRRVERAKGLLGEGNLPISQIAAEVGFAHQSHLAYHMRRVLGLSPKQVRKILR